MFTENLIQLRKLHNLTQEALAEQVGVSRQAIAKWESGESVPDLERSRRLAQVFDVSLDELANFSSETVPLPVPPRGKYVFGVVTVGEKGQIVIPQKARKVFGIDTGDRLIVLGDETQGIALLKEDAFFAMAEQIRKM